VNKRIDQFFGGSVIDLGRIAREHHNKVSRGRM
jgi:hypothetical protein